MGVQDMPAAEVEIPTDLVRSLLAEQHPDLSCLQLAVLASGWDKRTLVPPSWDTELPHALMLAATFSTPILALIGCHLHATQRFSASS